MGVVRILRSPLLVGRDEVLRLADRRIEDARSGRGNTLLVAGEAGIGKTRVLGSILRTAEQTGFRWMKGDLAPQDQLVPLASIKDMARWFKPAEWGSLGADLLSTRGGKGGDSLASRRILVHEIANLFMDAIDAPTLLAFEDLQWADELTLEVIGELARLAVDRPLLVVGIYRPEELPAGSIHREWRSRLLTQRLAEEIVLERLDPDETAQMTTLILGTGLPAPRDVAEAVHERTNGIPLHIEELLGALADQAMEGRAIRSAAVPSTIEDAVLARAARLSPEARAVARAGAVVGRCFPPEVLIGIMQRSLSELEGPLVELVAAGIVYPFDFIDHGFYDFRHQLLRDALYASVPRSELRLLHARTAEFSSELVGATEIHASIHYERAGMRAQAFRAALAGARDAGAVSSRFEAFELYRHAIANIPADLSPAELGDLYTEYGTAAFAIDDVLATEEASSLARRYYVEANRPVDAAGALIALSSMARRDVRPRSERKSLLDQADDELRLLPQSTARSEALGDLRIMQTVFELDAVNLPEARRLLAEARAFIHESPRRQTRITYELDIDHLLGEVEALSGHPEVGLAAMLDISRRARDANMEITGVTGYRVAADVAFRLMELEPSRIGIEEGIRFADEIEQSYCRHVMAATSALIAWVDGRWDDAVATAELELVQRGSRRGAVGSRAALAFVAFGRGDVERARTLLDASLAITRPSGEVDIVLPALWGLAETALIAGDPARALDHCWEAIELSEPTGERALLVPFVVTGVRAALLERRPEAARRWLERVTPMLSTWPDLARPALDQAEGLVRTAAGATIASRVALEAAIAGWAARGRTWELAWARLDLAAALVRAHRPGEALPVLDEVVQTARRLNSLPILRRGEELVRLARGRAGDQEPWHPLTSREFEVASLIAHGDTNGEIAQQIFVSPKTVSAHVEHILAKLGVARRLEIATWTASVTRVDGQLHPAVDEDTPSLTRAGTAEP